MERLSGLDASLLYLETATMQLNVAFTIVFDPADMVGGYDFGKIVALLANRAQTEPALRRRLVQVPFKLHHPVWVDDPNFDIVHHVRHVALPAPGDAEEFGAMVGRIVATPLDKARPLWEAWVIDGLEEGRSALVMKIHHSVVDGVAGAGLMMQLLSKSRREQSTEMPRPHVTGEDIPSDFELLRVALRSKLSSPVELAKLVGRSIGSVRQLLRESSDSSAHAKTAPLSGPRTFFNTRIGSRRNAAFVRISLTDVKKIKNATGTTVNDVVLAICGGALRGYLNGRGALPEKALTAMVPVSVRTDQQRGRANNRVSGMWSTLATHLEDPLARLAVIHDNMKGAKQNLNAIGADMLQDWAEFAPQRTLNLAVRFYTSLRFADRVSPIHNVIISNVPGPRYPLYLAGARVHAFSAMGPVMADMGLNISLMSYQDAVDLSILVDSDLIPDLWDLARSFAPAVTELLEAIEG